MNVLFVGGPHDGKRCEIAGHLDRITLPEPEPAANAGGLYRSPREQKLCHYDIVWSTRTIAIAVAAECDAGELVELLAAGYRRSATCECGVGFYCRLCGRELGE